MKPQVRILRPVKICAAALFAIQFAYVAYAYLFDAHPADDRDDVRALVIEEDPYQDLGVVDCGTPKVVSVTLRNRTHVPVFVTDVVKTCGCTEVRLDGATPIEPGQTRLMTVRMKAPDEPRVLNAGVVVRFRVHDRTPPVGENTKTAGEVHFVAKLTSACEVSGDSARTQKLVPVPDQLFSEQQCGNVLAIHEEMKQK